MTAFVDWLNRNEYKRMREAHARLMAQFDAAMQTTRAPITPRDFQVTRQTSLTVTFGVCKCDPSP